MSFKLPTLVALASFAALAGAVFSVGAGSTRSVDAGAPEPGPMFVSGDHAELNCPTAGECGGLYGAVVERVLEVSSNTGSVGLLVIGLDRDEDEDDSEVAAIDSWASPVVPTFIAGNGILSVDFDEYKAILVPSYQADAEDEGTETGLENEELARLNARAEEIAAFVRAGGGLIVLSEWGALESLAYKFVPLGAARELTGSNGEYTNVNATPALLTFAPGCGGTSLNHTESAPWRNTFSGNHGLTVLATKEGTSLAALLGTANLIIPPTPTPTATATRTSTATATNTPIPTATATTPPAATATTAPSNGGGGDDISGGPELRGGAGAAPTTAPANTPVTRPTSAVAGATVRAGTVLADGVTAPNAGYGNSDGGPSAIMLALLAIFGAAVVLASGAELRRRRQR